MIGVCVEAFYDARRGAPNEVSLRHNPTGTVIHGMNATGDTSRLRSTNEPDSARMNERDSARMNEIDSAR